MNHPLRRSRLFALALLAAAPLAAQNKPKLEKWQIDPYTDNEQKRIEAAGYVRYAPFPFGNLKANAAQTSDIDKLLEFEKILWIETPHFRIGTSLPQWQVPTEMKTRNKLRAELTEMQKVLPKINPKTRRLDPWLRAHLTAYRMEKLYREVQELFGVKDEDFPQDASKVLITPGARYMGYGPYLGMKDKFLVLVFDKLGPYQTYLSSSAGRDSKFPQRWHFTDLSSLLFSCACESDQFPLKHDTALHCALAFNVGQNLLDGFRYYAYDMPVWIREGFGHWCSRRIDGDWSNFDQNEGSVADMKVIDRWDVYCRSMMGTDKYAPFAAVAEWRDFGLIKFNDHVAIWSRMDWLISQGPEKWRKFLFAVKGRVNERWEPDQKDLVGATREALKDAYGLNFLNLDERWAEWVKETYPAQ